jgi:hypothetical protein
MFSKAMQWRYDELISRKAGLSWGGFIALPAEGR